MEISLAGLVEEALASHHWFNTEFLEKNCGTLLGPNVSLRPLPSHLQCC